MQSNTNDTNRRVSVGLPVVVSPRLPGGDVLRLEADSEKMQITTWQGVYGNRESRVVLTVPFSQVIDTECTDWLLLPVVTCRLRYKDATGKERVLKLRAFDQASHNGRLDGQQRENKYTEAVAEALENLRQGKEAELPALEFEPSGSMHKLLAAGAILGAIVALASVISGDGLAALGFIGRLLGSLLFSASVAALGIDLVRIHTGWHPVAKIVAYVLFVLVAFVLFAILGFLFIEVLV
jgi:hypothetical protein